VNSLSPGQFRGVFVRADSALEKSMQPYRMSGLSEARKRLVLLMQQLNFGRIEGLVVRRGEPVFEPSPTIIREVKFGGDNMPRTEARLQDFVLKQQQCELLRILDEVQNGLIGTISVKHGIPFHAELPT